MAIKLKLFPVYGAAEIFQSLDIKFSFVNADMEQVTNPIKCRDFLGDCIWSMKTDRKASIYGFKYYFKDKPYDTEITRLSMKFSNDASRTNLVNRISELNAWEEKFGITPTKLEETEEKDTLLVTGDVRWQSNRWKISLYTFLLKRYSYESDQHLKSPENIYITHLPDEKLNHLLSKIDVEKEFDSSEISYIHNYSGFVSLLSKNSVCKETVEAVGL